MNVRESTIVLLIAVFAACGDSSTTSPARVADLVPTAPLLAGACTGTVTEYCQRVAGGCLTFDEAVARRAPLCTQPARWSVETRHCPGVYRSVRWSDAVLGGGEEYFDGDGYLFAAYAFTDYHAYCGRRSFTQTFGDRPECPEPPVTASVCSP